MADTSQLNGAPTDATIDRRDLKFPLDGVDLRNWHAQGTHVAHFYNALSLFFPEGEAFFIDAVRHHAPLVKSERLAEEVEGFCGQEAMHSREHRRYNRALAAAGLPAVPLEKGVVALLDRIRSLTTPAQQLAATIALEHFTAMLAGQLLEATEELEGADPRMSSLWRWHAIEETEHKAVAYDVYCETVGEGPGAYLLRSGAMLLATALLWSMVLAYHARLVQVDGKLTDVAGWGRYLKFLWVKPGVLRKLAVPWLDYFRPSFHPWQHDNFALVRAWKALFAESGRVPA